MRLPQATDTRLLVAGAGAALALAGYLSVAFANTPAASSANTNAAASPNPTTRSRVSEVAPWTPVNSKLIPVRRRKAHGYDVRVVPEAPGSFGAWVPTLVPSPTPGVRFVVKLTLKAPRPGPLGVQIHVFRSGSPSRYLVDTTVHGKARWHVFTFRGRVKGSWLGISLFVYRDAEAGARRWFATRGLTVRLR